MKKSKLIIILTILLLGLTPLMSKPIIGVQGKITPLTMRIDEATSTTHLDKKYEIHLKSRQFIPKPGINATMVKKIKAKVPMLERIHVLIQLDHIPGGEERKELEKNGVKLLSYIPNKAWFASIPRVEPEKVAALPIVRSIEEILPEDKISPAVRNKNYIENEDGKINLSIMFFKDANLDNASSSMKNHGEVVDRFYLANSVKIITEESFISDIANEENVQWIDVIDKILRLHNDGSRENVGVNILQTAPYNLSGAGVVTSEWDGGWADTTHDDLEGRVTIGDAGCTETYCNTDDHATHVAGTMLGNGTLSAAKGGTSLQWRGMAPNATVISYEWWDDSTELNNEYDSAINTYNASLSQNSWSYEYNNCGSDCSGGYDSFATELDEIIRGSKGKQINQIWSASNKRANNPQNGYCDNGVNYDCIGIPATAKNVITVGATNSNDDTMTSFSSWGPTNDGRLKPEVTAPGCQVGGDGGVKSTVPVDNYGVKCGTSMAAPATSGVVALMLEEFENKGVYPLPSTIKGILIHNAKDLGNTGPDYSFGYGRINATVSVDMIKEDSETNEIILEDDISNGESDEFDMTVPQEASSVKVTLVWDDYPATANADPTLANDLDLLLIDPTGSVYYPWVLDPNNPGNAATTGTNTLDNVEQVYVANPQGGIWKVKVNGTTVPNGPQNYSLISDLPFTSVLVKTFRDSSYSQEDKFFDNREVVFIQANLTVRGQPSEGNTVTADLILSNGTVEDSLTLTEIGNGIYRNSWDSTSRTIDVYLINVTVSGNISGSGTSQFHLYPGGNVSAYRMEWNRNNNEDYVLENLHLIAVFDGKNSTDTSLLYIEQKDTTVSYNFSSISDSDTIGRGELTITNMKDIDFFSLSMAEGENLQSAELQMKIKIDDPTQSFLCSDGSNECQVANGFFYKDGTTPIECTSTYLSDNSSQNTDCSFSTQQDGGKGAFMQCEYNVSDIPEGSTLDDVTVHINMDINLWDGGSNAGNFDLEYYNCSSANWVFGENKAYSSPGEKDFYSNNYASTFSWWEQCSGTFKFRWFLKTNWVGSPDYDYLDMCSLRVEYTSPSITTVLNATAQMNSEDVDYLVYTLNDFDQNISNISDVFVAISGSFDAIDDDRYHLQIGEDDLITSLPAGQWNNFPSNYTAIYDNSSSDDVNDNVIAFVKFNETENITFQDVGLWNDTDGKEGLRIRYNTTSTKVSDEVVYMLAFTRGDWQVIDRWMPSINKGQLPSPNFMTSPITNLTAIYNNDGTITLTWNGSAASYDIYITNNYSAGFNLSNPYETEINTTSWTDENASLHKERYYKVGVTNGTISDETVGKFDIELYSGLNLVSLPLIPHNNSISEAMHQNDTFYPIAEIASLNADGDYDITTFYLENSPSYWWSSDNLTTLDNDKGYWFNVSLDSTGSELQITNTTTDEHYAFPSDEIIVWHVDINSTYPKQNIYSCNLSLNGNLGGCLANDEKTPITNYTPAPYGLAKFPVIDGDIIAWGDNSTGEDDVFVCNLSLNGGYGGCLENDTKIRLTIDPYYQCCPEVSGNIVVWQDKRLNPSVLDVFMYDLSMDSDGDGLPNYLEDSTDHPNATGRPDPDPAEANLTSLPKYQSWPQIYGNRIVWHDLRHNIGPGWYNWEIFIYDLGPDGRYNTSDDGGEVQITNNITGAQWKPTIYGDSIIWLDNRYNKSAKEDDVVMYNISSETETWVTNDTYYQKRARIHGDVIVWDDNRTGYWDIYMCDLTKNGGDGGCLTNDNKTRLTNLSADQWNPKVYKDKITWEDNRSGNFDIYMYTVPKESYNFTLVGEVPSSNRSVNLTQGFNLVGWTSLEERELWNAINQSATNYNITEIASFNAGNGYMISTFYPENSPYYWWSSNSFYSLSPDNGYWFEINQSFVWNYAP